METPEYIDRLRIVGGDPALDFVNTEDGDPPSECLRNYGDLLAWSVRVGLLSADEGERLASEANRRPEDAEAAYRDALRLREALYGIFHTLAEDEAPPSENLEVLRGYECEALLHGRLVQRDGDFAWEWKDGRDLAGMLWPIAHAATGLLTSGDLDRLKLCAGCYWVFLDASRNRSRRWCTMEVCGTDEKMRRYVAKRAARRGTGSG
ncbi:MAG: ABATE domain-containing protein [Rubrobacteraceae bacterium]|nr:ABATE domain-containing protein [Rubrobacteraceae bacterium]